MTGWLVAALVLGLGLFLLRHLVEGAGLTVVEQATLAVGLGLGALALASLLAGLPLGAAIVALALALLALPIVLLRSVNRRLRPPPAAGRAHDLRAPSPRELGALALCLLLAAFLRLRHLGYSELQGDEARAALMARHLGEARDAGILLRHKKGPIEVLLPVAGLRRGDLSEGTARLPFALAGLAAVAALYALGRRLAGWGPRAALVAATLAALDGYLVAFSRIVQYQSVVLLCGVLAVGCAWRWSRRQAAGAAGGTSELLLAGAFLGLGTWAHYEAVLALPPVAYLAWSGARRPGGSVGAAARRLAPAALVLGLVVAAFYLPFALHPQFAETWRYIADRRVGGSPPYNMLGDYFLRASFYNSAYYVLLIAGGAILAVAARLRAIWGRAARPWLAAWLAALAALFARPAWFELAAATEDTPARSAAVLLFVPALALAILGRPPADEDEGATLAWRALLLWLAFPLLAAGFLVKKPHTHFYTLLPAWLLLVGWVLDRAAAWLEAVWGRRGRLLGASSGLALVLVLGLHQFVVFVRHNPEYKRVYPDARLPGYWAPFGDDPPRGGYFGFPYRAGWRVVQDLYRGGALQGSYTSNEELLITGWYTWGAPRCDDDPRLVVVAWRPQDEEDLAPELVEGRPVWARVSVEGQAKLEVLGPRGDSGGGPSRPPVDLDVAMDARQVAEAWYGESGGERVEGFLARHAKPGRLRVGQALELEVAGESGVVCP